MVGECVLDVERDVISWELVVTVDLFNQYKNISFASQI